MYETSKSVIRRSYDKRFATRWMVGEGIDIGSGDDSIGLYCSLFRMVISVRPWDIPDGDAMMMASVADNSYDFVNSSHCLEHTEDPSKALNNWVRICKPGGHLLIIVPDEDLYEQGVWPSTYNTDHKWSFTIGKRESWCPRSINLIDLLRDVLDQVDILKIELLDTNFFYNVPRIDQTQALVVESGIEIILRKR